MIKLYKYLSEDVALKFIENPILRVTQSWDLNDPFECLIAQSDKAFLNNIKNGDLSTHMESFMSLHGIISLSETPDNLLMWSHYAGNHKGAVIEFTIDESDPFNLFNVCHIPISSDATLRKVNYRKNRKAPLNNSLEDLRNHYYLTKSDEWIYEKEYRYIFPITSIRFMKSSSKQTGLVELFESPDCKNKIDAWNDSVKNRDMFFVGINEKRITKIILGCNANISKFKAAMIDAERFADSVFKEFKNVEIAKIHPERYELDFVKLEGKV
ncbi:hypothetical protein CTM97_17930 [Photobacterium phosphoreum]|uniref:DUF2971 domain-containing protein n=1 Tax=Photobacterium phosphoreum TaxID=659 RepID=A0A2T3JCF7_PHOPO|nr:DUF2971 domain-containing protein [Photobacterium phosphoreum]PSU20403.1 hypothetical protein CTM96_19685 [Photobacterium phosphoreum]PSU39163.1 hypothetical protein CTM97_17930 [Photobacterium phosphoreum]PSU46528.1 hypothetical protein C9J18_20390 [Photobacterium phosphoreum]